MATKTLIALALTLLGPTTSNHVTALQETTSLGHQAVVAPTYGWPLKPFDRQHPVRAFLDDPRIGKEGGEAFHFGIDIAAADGTAVYAVNGGVAYVSARAVAVDAGRRHVFGYWHVRPVPSLRDHMIVRRHQLLGWIAPGWGHVHFAERLRGTYVNPLRPGGIGPYDDPVAPTVAAVSLRGTDLVVDAHDTPWPRVAGGWHDEPVTPALIRWRVDGSAWHVAADFRTRMLDRRLFGSVYAPDTTQNHEGRPGNFSFFLARNWQPGPGVHVVEVQASDTRGNRADAVAELTVS